MCFARFNRRFLVSKISDRSRVDEFCMAARFQRLALKNPPMTVEEFLPKLEDVGLPGTAACLRNCANRL